MRRVDNPSLRAPKKGTKLAFSAQKQAEPAEAARFHYRTGIMQRIVITAKNTQGTNFRSQIQNFGF